MDALAETADEGRGQRRNAPGSCKQALIRRSPNRETGQELCPVTVGPIHNPAEGTEGTETSQYLEEKKAIAIPPVVANEKGIAQTYAVFKAPAVAAWGLWVRTWQSWGSAGE